jgi:hypothetical protein
MKLESSFITLLLLAECSGTSSIGHGTLDDKRGSAGSAGTAGYLGTSLPNNTGGEPSTGGTAATGTGGRANGTGTGHIAVGGTGTGAAAPNDSGGEPSLPTDNGNAGVSSGLPNPSECSFTIYASEANDYTISTKFSFELTHVKPNVDLTFDWSGVTRDYLGNEIDPKADISYSDLSFIAFTNIGADELGQQLSNGGAFTPDELLELIGLDTMRSRTRANATDYQPLSKSAAYRDILMDFDPIAYKGFTYLLRVSSSLTPGLGTRMFATFTLDDQSENTNVVLTSRSTGFDYSANLQALSPAHIRPMSTHALFDFSRLKTNAYGQPFTQPVQISISEQSSSLADLQTHVLDLDAVADHVWTAPLGSETSLDIATLTDSDGQPFPGIDLDSGHTWLIALYADPTGLVPAPVYLTELGPCGVVR